MMSIEVVDIGGHLLRGVPNPVERCCTKKQALNFNTAHVRDRVAGGGRQRRDWDTGPS